MATAQEDKHIESKKLSKQKSTWFLLSSPFFLDDHKASWQCASKYQIASGVFNISNSYLKKSYNYTITKFYWMSKTSTHITSISIYSQITILCESSTILKYNPISRTLITLKKSSLTNQHAQFSSLANEIANFEF